MKLLIDHIRAKSFQNHAKIDKKLIKLKCDRYLLACHRPEELPPKERRRMFTTHWQIQKLTFKNFLYSLIK